jgi:hypothetical protein
MAVGGLVATCVLLAACGGGEERASGAATDTTTTSTITTATTTSNVIIQMTGLLLIVPPENDEDPVEVYLPRPDGVGVHSALLGFAVPTGTTLPEKFCDNDETSADPKTICYVNLTDWRLQPFGGGTLKTTTQIGYPPPVHTSGLADVTQLAGGHYKVFRQRALAQSVASITLLAGQLGGTTCRLAQWEVEHVNHQTGNTDSVVSASLSNVVHWEMRGVESAALVFTKGSDRVTVPLPDGDVWLLLAHIPEGERQYLPPGGAGTVTPSPTAHFRPYYNLLGTSAAAGEIPQDAAQRSVPEKVNGRTTPCPLILKSGAQLIDGAGSMATYACIPAVGQGGT